MKTLRKVLVCAIVCLLTMPVLAKSIDQNNSQPKSSKLLNVSVFNPFTLQVSAYRVRVYLHKTELVPGISYQYDSYIDIVEDYGPTTVTVPYTFTMDATLQTHTGYSQVVSATIQAGYQTSPLVTFYADHTLEFPEDLLSYHLSASSYGGIPIYFIYNIIVF